MIDGNLALAQLADADLDAGHHRVEDHRIHVVGDGPHVRAAFLLGSHEARLLIDIEDINVIAGPIDLRHVGVFRHVRDANVRLLANVQIEFS